MLSAIINTDVAVDMNIKIINTFLSIFCFKITSEEYENMRSQFVTSSENNN
jgi:hypothetical protein